MTKKIPATIKMPTRAQLIADLKRQGVDGKLSKMNKAQLTQLAEQRGSRRRPTIELEPLPESQRSDPLTVAGCAWCGLCAAVTDR
jgi:hypothetical protein